jgi:shikimate dehydrogenase
MPVLTAKTRLVGLIGWPVEHSLSPAMHNAAFAALGLDWVYLPLPVHPKRVGEAVFGLRALGFAGANVTVPHKQAVMDHLAEVSPDAEAIGAVNTIVVTGDGKLTGHNTDAAGFLRALGEAGFDPAGQRCIVLGAGGSARAVVYALATAGARVIVLNRTVERAQGLVHSLLPHLPSGTLLAAAPLTANDLSAHLDNARLMVNCTSAGMAPHVLRSPLPGGVILPWDMVVYDLVYNPAETLLLKQARSACARPVGGLGMLVHQGAESFRLWTGQEPPLDVMRQACQEQLHA